MKTRWISDTVKALLLLLIVFSIFIMIYPLPIITQEMVRDWQEIAYLHIPMLLISESMLAMFVIGLITIWYLLYLFDHDRTFTYAFTSKIGWIIALCIIVNIEIILAFILLWLEGGPGPGVSLLLVSLFLCISILGAVLYLVSHIIKLAIEMREETALTI